MRPSFREAHVHGWAVALLFYGAMMLLLYLGDLMAGGGR
jgi:hypothetical protein